MNLAASSALSAIAASTSASINERELQDSITCLLVGTEPATCCAAAPATDQICSLINCTDFSTGGLKDDANCSCSNIVDFCESTAAPIASFMPELTTWCTSTQVCCGEDTDNDAFNLCFQELGVDLGGVAEMFGGGTGFDEGGTAIMSTDSASFTDDKMSMPFDSEPFDVDTMSIPTESELSGLDGVDVSEWGVGDMSMPTSSESTAADEDPSNLVVEGTTMPTDTDAGSTTAANTEPTKTQYTTTAPPIEPTDFTGYLDGFGESETGAITTTAPSEAPTEAKKASVELEAPQPAANTSG